MIPVTRDEIGFEKWLSYHFRKGMNRASGRRNVFRLLPAGFFVIECYAFRDFEFFFEGKAKGRKTSFLNSSYFVIEILRRRLEGRKRSVRQLTGSRVLTVPTAILSLTLKIEVIYSQN